LISAPLTVLPAQGEAGPSGWIGQRFHHTEEKIMDYEAEFMRLLGFLDTMDDFLSSPFTELRELGIANLRNMVDQLRERFPLKTEEAPF
jgi:hypothetical protein